MSYKQIIYLFYILFLFLSGLQVDSEEAMTHEVTTALRSELAALEYKRDRLMSEVRKRYRKIAFFHISNREM